MLRRSVYFAFILSILVMLSSSGAAQKRSLPIVPADNKKESLHADPAPPAYVTGRVTDSYGRGISNTRVAIFNVNTNEGRYFSTNPFGYYRFIDLPVGDFYVMSAEHKKYLFLSGSISFQLEGNIADLDFELSY